MLEKCNIFLILIVALASAEEEWIDTNPNAFYVFENVESCLVLFKTEIGLVSKLKDLREQLLSHKALLHKAKHLQQRRALLMDTKKTLTDTLTAVNISTYPKEHDFKGAVKAMVILRDTYAYDVVPLFKGELVYTNAYKETKTYHSEEKLELVDVLGFAERAVDTYLHTTAMVFVREALEYNRHEKKLPKTDKIIKRLNHLRKSLAEFNNKVLIQKRLAIGAHHTIFPYLVDKNLNRKAQQREIKWEMLNMEHPPVADSMFRQTCSLGQFTHEGTALPSNCIMLHHYDPYLRLGPFKVEVVRKMPYLSIFHDILYDADIEYLVESARPNLSAQRGRDNVNLLKHESRRGGKKVRTIHKTIQHWMQEIMYHGEGERSFDRHNFTIKSEALLKLSKRIELATQMNITARDSSPDYQVTNYGLGGLCETHIDPKGYIEGMKLTKPSDKYQLPRSGDIIGTFMAWLNQVEAGGGTAFDYPYNEILVHPTRGSAAFWYNLNHKNHRSSLTHHGGCPVLVGSKWILNKWAYSFEQFEKFPCQLLPNNDEIPPPKGYLRNKMYV